MLSQPILELLARMQKAGDIESSGRESTIEVSSVIATAATFYEKVRYLVDYRDEHTIRRNAIERILRRRVLIERRTVHGDTLLRELVGGRYLTKQEATDDLAEVINSVIRKFLDVQNIANAGSATGKRLLSFAATEIESRINPFQYLLDEAIADAVHETLRGRVVVLNSREGQVDEQLYCAIWRSLFAADDERLAYALWRMCNPTWKNAEPDMNAVASELPRTMSRIKTAVNDQVQWQIATKIRNECIYFSVVREVLREHRAKAPHILENKAALDEFARAFLNKTYIEENKRVRGSGIRAVVYLCITKILLAFVIEVPYDLATVGTINFAPLFINVILPPALLFALTREIEALGDRNTEAVLRGVHRVLYTEEAGTPRTIRAGTRYPRMVLAFDIAYLLLVILISAGIVGILSMMDFSPVSMLLFLFFLALVSYFAFRIRSRGSRWRVSENQGVFGVLASIFTIPVIHTGRWLSRSFSTVNIFVLTMDLIIETPFKLLLHFSNQFILYLREKGDDLR